MADEDLSLNEDQLLDNLDEANGEHEAELMNENEVSTCKIMKSLYGIQISLNSCLIRAFSTITGSCSAED